MRPRFGGRVMPTVTVVSLGVGILFAGMRAGWTADAGPVALLLKVVTFDRNLKARAPDGLRIGVIYSSQDTDSLTEFDQVGAELAALMGDGVAGLPVTFVGVDAGFDDLEKLVAELRLNLFYVCRGNDAHLEKIIAVSRAHQVLTATSVSDYVGQGIAVGLGTSQTSPSRVHINLAASLDEGCHIDINFLQLTEVLR